MSRFNQVSHDIILAMLDRLNNWEEAMRKWRRRTRRPAVPPSELAGGRWPDRSHAWISMRTSTKQRGGKGGSILWASQARGDGEMGWRRWRSSLPRVNRWERSGVSRWEAHSRKRIKSKVFRWLRRVKRDLRPPVFLADPRNRRERQ
jgi:hypothetical protein